MTQKLGPNQEAWLRALESGKYNQGRLGLRTGDKFCCLGVGCVIANIHGCITYNSEWTFDGETTVAPRSLIEHLGLYDDNGSPSTYPPANGLTNLNDIGKSFTEIAALIRRDPSVYFREPR